MKKEKILKGILIFLFSFMLIGCESTTFNEKKDKDNPIISNEKVDNNVSNKENTTESKSDDNDSNKGNTQNKDENISNEKFFGKWIISKDLTTSSNITTYDANDINSIMSKTLNFSKEKATAFGESPKDLNNIIENPVYKKNTISKMEFEDSWRITFKDLGLDGDSVTEVKVSSLKSQSTCDFIIKDDNTLILFGGGVFLEVKKQL